MVTALYILPSKLLPSLSFCFLKRHLFLPRFLTYIYHCQSIKTSTIYLDLEEAGTDYFIIRIMQTHDTLYMEATSPGVVTPRLILFNLCLWPWVFQPWGWDPLRRATVLRSFKYLKQLNMLKQSLETLSISLEITDTNKPQSILQHRRCGWRIVPSSSVSLFSRKRLWSINCEKNISGGNMSGLWGSVGYCIENSQFYPSTHFKKSDMLWFSWCIAFLASNQIIKWVTLPIFSSVKSLNHLFGWSVLFKNKIVPCWLRIVHQPWTHSVAVSPGWVL